VNPEVTVRARFERFPATLKGAFILRGEDPDPHQVVLHGARAVRVGGGQERPVGLIDTTLDIAPKQDVFVPFETSVAELEPGWYDLACDLDVDGVARTYDGGRRFVVPWPRASTRRGQIRIGKDAKLRAGRVRVEQVECGSDSIKLLVQGPKSQPLTVEVSADGEPLPVLELSMDEQTGRGKVVAYPLLKTHRSITVAVASATDDVARVDFDLP
jgi:hypothetical protein